MNFIHHWNLRLTSGGADPGLQERESGTTATAPAGAEPLSGPASGGPVAAAHGEHLLYTCSTLYTLLGSFVNLLSHTEAHTDIDIASAFRLVSFWESVHANAS